MQNLVLLSIYHGEGERACRIVYALQLGDVAVECDSVVISTQVPDEVVVHVETQEERTNRVTDALLRGMLESRGIDYGDPFHPVKYMDRELLVDLSKALVCFMYGDSGDSVCFSGLRIKDLTVEQLRKLYLYLYHEYGGTTA